MTKFFSLAIFSLLSGIVSAQNSGITTKARPSDYEYLSAPDSTGRRIPLKIPAYNGNLRSQHAELPYPIIFIHGLNSSSATWNVSTEVMDSHFGTVYGGRFDFCLNADANNALGNTDFYPNSGADLALYTPSLIAGDYYYLNFDVGTDGSVSPSSSSPYSVESNQSAVVKQGLAVKWAIYYVLQKTGKDKVILMGHSMGGLAAREYLENSGLWQTDGQHHVAKLVTTGTPHGGSNTSFPISAFGLPDEESDAVRDLRTDYTYSGDLGVYLFGGYEDNSVMDDMLFSNFYNVDVNCDGYIEENITGLNLKSISSDLDYSCIIGECTTCTLGEELPGDGVVNDSKANLVNYYSTLKSNTFYYYASAVTEIHTNLPSQTYQNMQGLDEPDNYNLAYRIGFDTLYRGFTSVQDPNDQNYPTDFDLFKFNVPVRSDVYVNIGNVTLPNLYVNIVDANYSLVGVGSQSNGSATISLTQTLNAGNYYLNIYGVATNAVYPYTYLLSRFDATTGIANEKLDDVVIYPNPVKDQLVVTSGINESLNFEIVTSIGQVLYKSILLNKAIIDTDNFPKGVYLLKFDSDKLPYFRKFVKE